MIPVVAVAQLFNLPYRRFINGKVSVKPIAPDPADALQDEILRYSRLQICATSKWPPLSV